MADFAPADEVEDESSAEDSETDLATDEIEDADDAEDAGEETEDTSSEEKVELAWVPEGDDPEMALSDAIEANSSMIEDTPSNYALESLEHTIEGLRDALAELREENEALRKRVKSLEGWRGSTVGTVNRNIADINRLTAAIFGNEPPCPECENGHLEHNSGWGGETITCSDCEFEEELE